MGGKNESDGIFRKLFTDNHREHAPYGCQGVYPVDAPIYSAYPCMGSDA
jgi:hypothetical protein